MLFSCVLALSSLTVKTSIKEEQKSTATPIKHLVVIFDENSSFDHYFGTYPIAKNPPGEPQFHAAPHTPIPNNYISHPNLLTNNPNLANPQRIDRVDLTVRGNNHGYKWEQEDYDGGKVDKFVQVNGYKTTMNYFDGNTVTALWNYAQHFAMSDNAFCTTYGPTLVGHLNLISGQTHGVIVYSNGVTSGRAKELYLGKKGYPPSSIISNRTVIQNIAPYYDNTTHTVSIAMTGKNIGDLLNSKHITWGYFKGGFHDPSNTVKSLTGRISKEYSSYEEPFQYYESTANPDHLYPTSVAMIGHQDRANHQYDIKEFWQAADSGNLPAVSFIKAPSFETGHPGTSNPLDEQIFLVNTINNIQKLSTWKSTAIIITYDDSDGWYDQVMPPLVNGSQDPKNDRLFGIGNTGVHKPVLGGYQDRAGYGPRLPFLVISPYAKQDFIAHTVINQASILRFIEDNWHLSRIGGASFDAISGSIDNMFNFKHLYDNKLFLDQNTGEPIPASKAPVPNMNF